MTNGNYVRRAVVALFIATLGACSSPAMGAKDFAPESLPDGPFVVVLGSAQDGGLPQLACRDELCENARRNPAARRFVASLLIVDPRSGQRWLIDATPDLPEQVELADVYSARKVVAGRAPLFEAIFLTHAHFGHYTGLGFLGREVYGSEVTPVFASRRMSSFLASNGPWDLLVKEKHIELNVLEPGVAVALAPDLHVRPFLAPHRDEYSDTFGFVIEGPSQRLVYLPDVDKWPLLKPPIEERILAADYALLDGSFFAEGEIPGRAMSEIPHPFVAESLQRFGPLPAIERAKIYFTHLNHTNPITASDSPEAQQVLDAGFRIASDGLVLPL